MKEKIKVLYTNKALRLVTYSIGILFILGITFQLGMFVGFHKANFARDWSESYGKNFGFERPESFGGMMRGKFPMSHGSAGKVLTVNDSSITIADIDGSEKIIIISSNTIIKDGPRNASSSSIKTNSDVVVLGEPNANGQIEAKLIRIMGNGSTTNMMGGPQGMPGMMPRR